MPLAAEAVPELQGAFPMMQLRGFFRHLCHSLPRIIRQSDPAPYAGCFQIAVQSTDMIPETACLVRDTFTNTFQAQM